MKKKKKRQKEKEESMRNFKMIRVTLVNLIMHSFFLFPQSFCTYSRQQIAPIDLL